MPHRTTAADGDGTARNQDAALKAETHIAGWRGGLRRRNSQRKNSRTPCTARRPEIFTGAAGLHLHRLPHLGHRMRRAKAGISRCSAALRGKEGDVQTREVILDKVHDISMDHMAQLGDTLEQIARQKAGIIKPHTLVACAAQPPEATQVIEEVCAANHSPCRMVDGAQLSDICYGYKTQTFSYIEDLERNLNIPVELIYATALLHDIGRPLEYQRGIPHHQASAAAAEPILRDCGFSGEEQETILAAVLRHRTEGTALEDNLAGLLYRADKASRDCLLCPAADACRWSPEKKNLTLKR